MKCSMQGGGADDGQIDGWGVDGGRSNRSNSTKYRTIDAIRSREAATPPYPPPWFASCVLTKAAISKISSAAGSEQSMVNFWTPFFEEVFLVDATFFFGAAATGAAAAALIAVGGWV